MSDRTTIPPPDQARIVWQEPPCLTAALAYLAMGWSPIRLCPHDHGGTLPKKHLERCHKPGKVPFEGWTEYRGKRATERQLRAWWAINRRYNVGVLTGTISGLLMFDLDGPRCEEEYQRLFSGSLPPTWEFRSGRRGRRVVFALPPGESLPSFGIKAGEEKLSILCDKGMSVMPPSIHECGGLYVWTHAPADLSELCTRHVVYPDGSPYSPNEESNITLVSNLSVIPTPALELLREEYRRRTAGRRGEGSEKEAAPVRGPTWQRAAGLARSWRLAVPSQGGHDTTYALACALVKGLGCDREMALRALREVYNPRLDEQWTESDLEHKVDDAIARGHFDPIPERNGSQPVHFQSRAAGPEGNGAPKEEKKHPLLGARGDIVTNRPLTWFWQNRIPFETATILEGKKGRGKTTLLAACVADATGGPRLPGPDREPRVLGRVLIFSSEDSPGGGWKRRLIAAGADLSMVHYPDRDNDGNVVQRPALPENADRIEEMIIESNAKIVIFDPIITFFSSGMGWKDEQQSRITLQPLLDIALRTGCAFLLVRHIPKTETRVAEDRGGGSVGIGNVVRSVLVADRHPSERGLFVLAVVSCNDGTPGPSYAYRLEGSEGAPVVKWGDEIPITADQLAAGVADPSEEEEHTDGGSLMRYLLKDGPMWSKEVLQRAKEAGVSERTMRKWKKLYKVTSVDRTVDGVKRRYWHPPRGGFPKEE